MPNPEKYSDRKKYMSDCVKEQKNEGKSAKKARSICFAAWAENKES